MRSAFNATPESHDHACRMLEALCEGYVLAMLEEFDAFPEGEFPCCIKCGGFRTRNAPLTPCQAESIDETLQHGHPVSGLQRHRLADVLESHGYERNADMTVVDPVDYSRAGAGVPISAWLGVRPGPGQRSRTGTVRVRSARQILRNKGGHTVELACYQCAMKRRTGADPGAKVIICSVVPGTFRGAVLMSDQHKKPERRLRLDDPVVDARPEGDCACVIPAKAGA